MKGKKELVVACFYDEEGKPVQDIIQESFLLFVKCRASGADGQYADT